MINKSMNPLFRVNLSTSNRLCEKGGFFMKKVLLNIGASALALTLMTGCGTSNDDEPADDNPTIDHEERDDELNNDQENRDNQDDQMDRDDDLNNDDQMDRNDDELPRDDDDR